MAPAIASATAVAPVRYRITNGCLFGRAASDSWRYQTIFTGRRVAHTSSAR